MKSITRIAAALLLFVFAQPHALLAQSSLAGETLHISRVTGTIKIDGNLSDEGWQSVKPVTTWYEVNPGDNTPPKVRNVGRIAYDDRFLYAAFEFDDPNPQAIRAPYSDRDDAGGGFYDFGGIFVDAGNSGRTAKLFVVTPRNIQAGFGHRRCFRGGHIAGLLLGIGDEDHGSRMDARDADSVRVASLQERRSPDLGDPDVPQLSARPQLPVLLGENAARVQLLRLSRQHARRPAAAAGGRSSGRRAVRQLQLVRPSGGRSRIAAGHRSDAEPHRRRRQVHAQFGHRRRPDRQAGLLAGRVGRRANLRERTVRVVRPGKAILLSRGRRSAADADSSRLHAHDHRAELWAGG